MSSGSGYEVIDFGAGADAAQVQITTPMVGITANALIECWVMPIDSTALGNGHTEDEHAILPALARFWSPRSSINVAGEYAIIFGQSLAGKIAGKWYISYAWSG